MGCFPKMVKDTSGFIGRIRDSVAFTPQIRFVTKLIFVLRQNLGFLRRPKPFIEWVHPICRFHTLNAIYGRGVDPAS